MSKVSLAARIVCTLGLLSAGGLPALTSLYLQSIHVGDAGASALAAALAHRRPAAAPDPQSVRRRHRRRGAGGPRAGPAAAARAAAHRRLLPAAAPTAPPSPLSHRCSPSRSTARRAVPALKQL